MKELVTTLAAASIETVGDGDGDLVGSVTGILNAVIAVLGIVAVIVIIIGGVSYMTSSGDAGKVKKAKDTILYGVIGLVIVALSFAIVNFVIGNILAGQLINNISRTAGDIFYQKSVPRGDAF